MKKIYVLNPKNKSELEKFNALDIDKKELVNKYSTDILNQVQICRVLYTESKGVVEDFCTLDLMTDLKNCLLTFPTMDQTKRSRPFIKQAISFANELGSEEVLVSINLDDTKTRKFLESQEEFTSFPVDQEDRKLLFLHEKAAELVNSRVL